MAAVISDTGPLIAFARADLLDVPRRLFTSIQIPEAVWHECHGRTGEDTLRIADAVHRGWLQVVPPRTDPTPRVPTHSARHLGRGEVAAMESARAADRALLIVDDRIARRAALQLGVDFVGTVRVLWLAEREAVIDSAADAIEQMAAGGYRISLTILDDLRREPG